MTNIPFEPKEARHWLDQVLLGGWASISPTLDVFKLPHTLAGMRLLLDMWIDVIKPEYFMASMPISFEYPDENASTSAGTTAVPNGAKLLLQVLLTLAEVKKPSIALKFDSVLPINARCGVDGDGVLPSNVDILIKLFRAFPKVNHLAAFLSRPKQHKVTVAANKFRYLHPYGCWWYCNNPSTSEELTCMHVEILSTAFTSQHSDARLFATGWKMSKSDIQRDVQRLFGQSFAEFTAKSM
ncbi:unnamed protein product [Hyaloperonospora brassicae]|nr:unnamed protein product [Hyaloperonospora brassicae]